MERLCMAEMVSKVLEREKKTTLHSYTRSQFWIVCYLPWQLTVKIVPFKFLYRQIGSFLGTYNFPSYVGYVRYDIFSQMGNLLR